MGSLSKLNIFSLLDEMGTWILFTELSGEILYWIGSEFHKHSREKKTVSDHLICYYLLRQITCQQMNIGFRRFLFIKNPASECRLWICVVSQISDEMQW